LESTIHEILYSDSPSIMNSIRAGWVLLKKVIEVVGLSMEIYKTGCIESIDSWRQRVNNRVLVSRSLTVDFILFSLFTWFYFSFYFTLLFFLLLIFYFLEQLRLGFISHAVTSVTNWWCSHKTDHETWKKEVEGSGTKWHHTAWTTHAGLMLYSW